MKLRFVRVICVIAIFILCVQAGKAQPYHQLNINDFEGIPRPNRAGAIAYTNCTIDFHYQATKASGYYRLRFSVQLIMNRNKSWIDRSRIQSVKQLAEILKHEQGHYTIAYLEQQELIRMLEKTRFGADYQQAASSLFDRIDAKYKQLNHDYDDETANMRNREQQGNWDAFFKKRLEYMPDEES